MVRRITASAAIMSAVAFASINSAYAQSNFPWRSQVDSLPATATETYRVQLPPAQSSSANFNRVTSAQQTRAHNNQVRVAQLQQGNTATITRIPAASATPLPPNISKQPFLVSFKKHSAQQVDVPGQVESQPSVSDIGDYNFDVPASPEAQAGDLQYQGGSPEPQLQVPSAPADTTDYCARDCRKPFLPCNLGCEKKLFGKTCNGFEMGGWASLGYHNRNTNVKNNRKSELNLHQFWLYAQNEASRNSASWDTGFRVDGLYGVDAQDLQAFGNPPVGAPDGWDNGWDNGSYGFAAPQMYLQFANYQWDVKLGKFFSPFGYEVIGATGNFFYSNNYTMYNSEPFTMTGLLGERTISDRTSIIMGVTGGWDTGFDSVDDALTLITGVRHQLNNDVSLALTSSLGDTGSRGSGRMTTAVAEVQLTESLNYVLHGNVLNLDDNNEFGIVQYLFRDMSPCLALGARLEWWKTDALFGGPNRSTYDFTMGANYRANSNLVIRPELRFDWGAAAVDPGTPIVGIDAVMTF